MQGLAPKRIRGQLLEIPIHWEMYNFHVWCVIGPHADLPRYVKWRQNSEWNYHAARDVAGLYCKRINSGGGVLWLAAAPRRPNQLAYLAHEMGHAAMDLVRYAGMRLNSKTEETLCYAVAFGVQRVLEGVRK
jgi:hypothetical protein